MNPTRFRIFSLIAHSVLTVLGLTGVAALFLPFTFDVSPMEGAFDKDWELRHLALPFFLAPFASAGSLRWIISGSFSRFERAIAYLLGTTAAVLTLSLYMLLDYPSGVQEWLFFVELFVVPLATLCVGICLLIRNSRMKLAGKFNPVMAIQISYLAHSALLLMIFFGDWQVGAYCVLAAVGIFILQIVLISGAPGFEAGE